MRETTYNNEACGDHTWLRKFKLKHALTETIMNWNVRRQNTPMMRNTGKARREEWPQQKTKLAQLTTQNMQCANKEESKERAQSITGANHMEQKTNLKC